MNFYTYQINYSRSEKLKINYHNWKKSKIKSCNAKKSLLYDFLNQKNYFNCLKNSNKIPLFSFSGVKTSKILGFSF